MWAQTMKTARMHAVPVANMPNEFRVAVLLNAHARKVDRTVIDALRHTVSPEDLFISESSFDARKIAQTVVERGYEIVFTGGGDGTFMGFANEILNEVRAQKRHRVVAVPRFGVLKLGTGNSLASWVNASAPRNNGFVDDVLKAKVRAFNRFRTLELLEVDGKRAPFAGLGVDGKLLNDYFWVKQHWAKGPFTRLLTGSRGYFTSVALRTLPYYFTHSTKVTCEVKNVGTLPAFRLDKQGRAHGKPVAPGETLYEGPVMLVCAGTVPHYGYELKMFPFAGQRPGMMHLRLGSVTPTGVVANLPKIWAGTYFPQSIFDFHAQQVEIQYAEPMPLQIGGDAEGYRKNVVLGMSKDTLELVDFSGSPSN